MKGQNDCIAQCCAEASAGYAVAALAAYTECATRIFDFWSTALGGLGAESEKLPTLPPPAAEPPFGMSLSDWTPWFWLDTRRFDALMRITPATPPVEAWMAIADTTMPLRGNSASWGMAKVMIDSGVPRSVAWPAAEANAAALRAADKASNGFRSIVANYHTESGFAGAVRGMTPTMVVLAMTFMPAMMPAVAQNSRLFS